MGAIIILYGLMIIYMRKLYQNFYQEEDSFFILNKLFGDYKVYFSDIKEVNYYFSNLGGKGIRLRDFSGKKYNIPSGYFDHHKLQIYLRLNAREDFF